mmetsp:Transcript_95025/g.188251  ORF Transcript_95025/g.188251 Transcript_95025/m.188251 type:complete len:336 (+) Transcript_95025:116-1123(+)|eukprot:CAMPEP_0172724212 /NCGR_PEP_ID=MMETSP1074-20121228/85447_1 /TAXON_ID=2916 /ORGANISM="Ceratium fusus, Strain PA161109" /LENGTH=335 /DNA_ID=CAMNT_0013550619 /DNA_START=86 /DNA_END=1093 /DNA_ORIENTATION=+
MIALRLIIASCWMVQGVAERSADSGQGAARLDLGTLKKQGSVLIVADFDFCFDLFGQAKTWDNTYLILQQYNTKVSDNKKRRALKPVLGTKDESETKQLQTAAATTMKEEERQIQQLKKVLTSSKLPKFMEVDQQTNFRAGFVLEKLKEYLQTITGQADGVWLKDGSARQSDEMDGMCDPDPDDMRNGKSKPVLEAIVNDTAGWIRGERLDANPDYQPFLDDWVLKLCNPQTYKETQTDIKLEVIKTAYKDAEKLGVAAVYHFDRNDAGFLSMVKQKVQIPEGIPVYQVPFDWNSLLYTARGTIKLASVTKLQKDGDSYKEELVKSGDSMYLRRY